MRFDIVNVVPLDDDVIPTSINRVTLAAINCRIIACGIRANANMVDMQLRKLAPSPKATQDAAVYGIFILTID
jgi:hypothetical protein